MVAAPIITTAIISVLIASFQTSVTIGDGIFGVAPTTINISDDSTYGTMSPTGTNFDLIYQQIRY